MFLGQSTRIYNRMTGEISYGYVPPGSVVVSGSLPAKDGSHSLYCAVIVKQVDAKIAPRPASMNCARPGRLIKPVGAAHGREGLIGEASRAHGVFLQGS